MLHRSMMREMPSAAQDNITRAAPAAPSRGAVRARWPKARILLRGDGHDARPEAVGWCETNGLQYVVGLPGSKPLSRKVEDIAGRSAALLRRRI